MIFSQENADDLQQNAVNLVKFFERLYKRLPQFAALAATPEFIDALVATLFPPVAPLVRVVIGGTMCYVVPSVVAKHLCFT